MPYSILLNCVDFAYRTKQNKQSINKMTKWHKDLKNYVNATMIDMIPNGENIMTNQKYISK